MIYTFFLDKSSIFFNLPLFRYLTFRTMAAFLTAFFISFFLGPFMIRWLKSRQKEGQPIRDDGPERHLLTKKGTPTMGGTLILIALVGATLLWANLANPYVWWILWITLGMGAVGGWDDYLKLSRFNSKGISARFKLMAQTFISLVAALWLMILFPEGMTDTLTFPFFKNISWHLGLFFPLFVCCVIVGTSNAVNLTDGLDGLAIGPLMIATAVFCVIAYVVGNSIFSNYLQLPHVPGVGELSVLCGALIGAGLGFLWYNAPPAMVFMGDTGSLAIGGFLGALGVATKHELVLAFVGGLFLMEALSVILQVAYYKRTRKRIFLMAPIHHHFEKKGWPETTIVFRFWTIAIILGVLGLATLKLR
ncbi:MAG: phospho-N-acetylmuramoyl-pentapeptide-transferase [Holosporales bacterium]|jgi:phospho-N-acetylmuramoyl-pentapeptide-transferase